MFKRSGTMLAVALAVAAIGTSGCEMQRGATDLLQPSQIESSRGVAVGLKKLHSARHTRPVVVKRIGPAGGVLENAPGTIERYWIDLGEPRRLPRADAA